MSGDGIHPRRHHKGFRLGFASSSRSSKGSERCVHALPSHHAYSTPPTFTVGRNFPRWPLSLLSLALGHDPHPPRRRAFSPSLLQPSCPYPSLCLPCAAPTPRIIFPATNLLGSMGGPPSASSLGSRRCPPMLMPLAPPHYPARSLHSLLSLSTLTGSRPHPSQFPP